MERVIRRRLLGEKTLTALLSRFEGEPAIFYQRAPDDVDMASSYPQVILSAEKYYDERRGVCGQLTVDVLTTQLKASPELVERAIRQSLAGVFFSDAEIFSLRWSRTDLFTEPASERLPLIIGATILFDIYEYPKSVTSTPDVIDALNRWALQFDSRIKVIGLSELGAEYEPTRECPAVYFDLQKVRLKSQAVSGVVVEVTASCHVFAPGVLARREWLMAIHAALIMQKGLWLSEEAPARLLSSEFNAAFSETDGQLILIYECVIMRQGYATPLRAVKVG